eukprot:3193121-Pyramimonas_sp.AAC.1
MVAARGGFGCYEASEVVLVEGRAAAALIHVPGCAPFAIVSVYLVHSQGLSEANMDILRAVGTFLESQGCDFVVAGDFNFSPGVLFETNFAELLKGVIVSADGHTHFPAG